MDRYRVAGLELDSDLSMPGRTARSSSGPADVRIRRGSVPPIVGECVGDGPNWRIEGRDLRLAVPGLVRMTISDGREIVYDPEPGIAVEDIVVFVAGTAFGILLHQRGMVALHASAVLIDGNAVLFCGASGAGKSTMAAALAARGHPLVADDVCAITISDGVPYVQSDGRDLKLWERSVDRLDLHARRGAPVRPGVAKYHVASTASVDRAVPVGAVHVLRERRTGQGCEIRRPNFAEAGLLLRANAYRPALVGRFGQEQLYLETTAAILRHAGLFVLERPLRFGALDAVIAAIESGPVDGRSGA